PVRLTSHGPPDRWPAADALGALSGQLGVRPTGSPHRHERDARRTGSSDPRRCATGPRGHRIPPAHAARDARRDRVCPRKRRGGRLCAPDLLGGRRFGRPRAISPCRRPRADEGGRPILIGPRAFAGLVICAFLLGATWPILAALPGVPAHILAGDAYLVTQGSGAYSVNESLADNLTAQPWARIVSPEILSLGTLHGEPLVGRAANPVALFSLEGGTWVQPPS